MGWADFAKEALRKGETVLVKPRGHSMKGKVNDGDIVTLEPVNPEELAVGGLDDVGGGFSPSVTLNRVFAKNSGRGGSPQFRSAKPPRAAHARAHSFRSAKSQSKSKTSKRSTTSSSVETPRAKTKSTKSAAKVETAPKIETTTRSESAPAPAPTATPYVPPTLETSPSP